MANTAVKSSKRAEKWNGCKVKNGSRQKTKFGIGFCCYCGICPVEYAMGQQIGLIRISSGQKKATCRVGHTFQLAKW